MPSPNCPFQLSCPYRVRHNSMAVPTEPSNFRPIAIFSSYMLLCLSLSLLLISNIFRNCVPLTSIKASSRSPGKLITLFAVLAGLSLATTWYYMFRFFEASHNTWLLWHPGDFSQDGLQLGRWLRDTQLFKQAWGIAINGQHRYW